MVNANAEIRKYLLYLFSFLYHLFVCLFVLDIMGMAISTWKEKIGGLEFDIWTHVLKVVTGL